MSNNTFLDEFVDKMYLVPNDINRHLRLIRTLDKRAEVLQQALNQTQGRFLNQLKQYKDSSNGNVNGSNSLKKQTSLNINQLPALLKAQYERIITKQKQLYGYYKQKHEISQQLRAQVSEYYQQLDNQLRNKLKEKSEEERQMFQSRRKGVAKLLTGSLGPVGATSTKGPMNAGKIGSALVNGTNGSLNNNSSLQNGQFTYDPKEPTYCDCGRASFGEMVMCESPYCQKQWFHLDCLQQKNLPQKWYCKDCQRQREKTRNPHSRSFFVNKQT